MPNTPTNYHARTQQLTRGNILQARDLIPGDVIAYRVPGAIELQPHTVAGVTLNTHVQGWVAVDITLAGGHAFTVDTDMPVRVESAAPTYPAGITSFAPLPYGATRWNGAQWADSQVDQYNRELARVESRHRAGFDVTHLVNGLYNLAQQFDYVERSPRFTPADSLGDEWDTNGRTL